MMMRPRALTALTRFGLGPRPGDMERIAGDPVAATIEQCYSPEAALINADLPDRETLRVWHNEFQEEFRKARRAERSGTASTAMMGQADVLRDKRREFVRSTLQSEAYARFEHGVETDHPFIERLVLFWSDHFSVERNRNFVTRVTVGNFEREVIRPHVLGYFEDMLVASTMHPAMLSYLDNVDSVGPNSRAGRRRRAYRVIENLAREVLELHSLGADGGYSQDDVIALANTLTGWQGGFGARGGGAIFQPRFHEFGPRTILGKTYKVEGAEQLEAVLPDLAAHPSTARNIAEKFARHFVSDKVSEALVAELTDAFLETGGDLRELALTLLESDHAWGGEPSKTVPPYEFMVASMRATQSRIPPPNFLLRTTGSLAQGLWNPPSPAGWPSADTAFLGGDSLLERVDYARQLAARFVNVDSVPRLAEDLFGEALDPFVMEAIERAEDKNQALVLLLMSPAFHRR